MSYSKLEIDTDIYTLHNEECNKLVKEFSLENSHFSIEADEEKNFYLIIEFDFEDFCEGNEEDMNFFETFRKSIFYSKEHVTCYDGDNEIYKFPLGRDGYEVRGCLANYCNDIYALENN